MDAYEATRVVLSRIQAMDPDNAAKVMGLLLIQDHGEKEMIRLAFGPDALLRSVVAKARNDLGLLPPAPPSPLLLSTSPPTRMHPPMLPSPTSWPPLQPGGGSGDPGNAAAAAYLGGGGGVSYPEECLSPGGGDAMLLPFWGQHQHQHRRGCSELCPPEPPGLGWRPCHYYARGYCKNGSTCRFLHGLLPDDAASGDLDAAVEQQCHELLLRSKSQRLLPYSPSAAAALMLGGNESHILRSSQERDDLLNPSARQIYLTFPADSTFREEDVSNYFSIYGPVQDVRIPYQQKRMFGFVTFLYPETVKLILAKGNPHFVCDSRVLVKPYKEKGKVPEKFRMPRQQGDFSGCTTPTGLDARDPYDLGSRIMYSNQDALLRRKLEEQQQAAELQQAIELQSRRFMGLQLLDLKNRSFSSPMINATTAHLSPSITTATPVVSIAPLDAKTGGRSREGSPPTDKSSSSASGGEQELPHIASGKADVEAGADGNFQESCVEHNLPDSPFASPTNSPSINGSGANHILPSFNSCFFQMPRFSGHGAIGM